MRRRCFSNNTSAIKILAYIPFEKSLEAKEFFWMGGGYENPIVKRNYSMDVANKRLRLDNGQIMYLGEWDRSTPLTFHCEVEITRTTGLDQLFGIYPKSEIFYEGLMLVGRSGEYIGFSSSYIDWGVTPFQYSGRKIFFSFSFSYNKVSNTIDLSAYADGILILQIRNKDATAWKSSSSKNTQFVTIGQSYTSNNPYGFFRNFYITEYLINNQPLDFYKSLYP